MKIAILGAGAYGTALGQVLIENGYEIEYYDPALGDGLSLDEVINGAEMILLTVPSAVLSDIIRKIPKDKALIVATKGILDESIFKEFEDVMVFSGPGFAKDIKAHKITFLTANDKRVEEIFGTDYIKFDFTNDTRGILMCGALKNVYAIMAGFLDLKPDTIKHEEFLEEVVNEMKDILEANGGQKSTVDLPCGIGDLRLTCNAPSRNYDFGRRIRQDHSYHSNETIEGKVALEKICEGAIIVPSTAIYLQDLMRRSKEWN